MRGHRRDLMMLRRWAVCGQFVSRAYPRIYLSNWLKVLHTTPLGGLIVLLGYMNADLLLVQNYELFRRFDTHFVSTVDLENYRADDYNHIVHT